MSYDLTIRPNERFSQYRPFAPIAAFLAEQANVKPNGNRGFVVDDGQRWMEIDFETVSDMGKTLKTIPRFWWPRERGHATR